MYMYKGKKQFPEKWKMGPDVDTNEMYYAWMKRKAQAKFRHEEWELKWEDFYELWKDNWHQRGRLPDDLCMTRDDIEKPWSKENTILINRRRHLQRQKEMMKLKKS